MQPKTIKSNNNGCGTAPGILVSVENPGCMNKNVSEANFCWRKNTAEYNKTQQNMIFKTTGYEQQPTWHQNRFMFFLFMGHEQVIL